MAVVLMILIVVMVVSRLSRKSGIALRDQERREELAEAMCRRAQNRAISADQETTPTWCRWPFPAVHEPSRLTALV
jgi:hypothetical protein